MPEPNRQPEPPRIVEPSLWQQYRSMIAMSLGGVSVVLTVIRLGPRDTAQWLAPVYYATPAPVIAAVAFAAWLIVCRRPERIPKWPLGFLFLIMTVQFLRTWETGTPTEAPFRLGFWNVCSGNMGWDGVIEQIRTWDADLIGLAESNRDPFYDDIAERDRYWESHFSDHTMIRFPRGMRLFSKVPAQFYAQGQLGKNSRYGVARLTIRQQTVWVVMADLLSGPTLPRGPAFKSLHILLDNLPPGPVILMGDMNTPASSIHLDRLRNRLTNAFEESGRGLYHTWPVPLPVLSLDQIWHSSEVRGGTCELEWTVRSDHRPILFTFDLTE